MKICCGIILYNPLDEDIDNVLFYQKNFDRVYVYNNTEKKADEVDKKIVKKNTTKTSIVSSGSNDGLSIACQKLCEAAKSEGFDYIILFDQDSRMDKKSIEVMKNLNFQKDVAIYTPQIVYRGNKPINKRNIEYVNWCITSGSMLNLHYFGDNYNFDANYFIDKVDKDYCEQVIRTGKKIARINNSVLFQELGEMRIINGKPRYNHSTLRHYYMFRNRFYYNKKYKVKKIITLAQTISHLSKIILYETNKKEKIRVFIVAKRDFNRNNMGRNKIIEK